MSKKVITLVGASSVGKTTVFELIKGRLENYTFRNESTRTVKSYGFKINEDGGDTSQLAIAAIHLESLLQPGNLVLDRCMLDVLVYTRILDTSDEVTHFIEQMYNRTREHYTHMVYFPMEFPPVADGERSVDEKWRQQSDEIFREYLEQDFKGRYLTVTGSPKQRIEQILEFIEE